MEINIKKIMRLTKVLLVVLAFTFSSNISATTATSTSSTTMLTAKNKKPKPPKKKRKKKKKGGGDKIPLDGGLGILVLGAAAFGIKKLRSKKNDIA
tara:strand:- start:16629 stop:16916 length:288 start_codon:yes stop_codon:yes gene_type:complete